MITFNESNVLIIENEGMTLDIEDDIQDGITMTLSIPQAYITMTGLYKNDELKPFLDINKKDAHILVKSSLESRIIGKKKVRETIFSTKPLPFKKENETENDYKILFYTDDATIHFTLSEEEWEEIVQYIRFIVNGYQHIEN